MKTDDQNRRQLKDDYGNRKPNNETRNSQIECWKSKLEKSTMHTRHFNAQHQKPEIINQNHTQVHVRSHVLLNILTHVNV